MGIFKNDILNNMVDKITKQPTPSGKWEKGKFVKNEPISYSVSFEVAGIHYRMDNILKLATPMKKWKMTNEQILQKYPGKKIYKNYYINEPVQFVYEPTNPIDPNAIKVFINNLHVGYVPQSDCSSLKRLLETRPVTISATVSGGEYKIVYGDGQKEEYSEPMVIKIRVNTQR